MRPPPHHHPPPPPTQQRARDADARRARRAFDLPRSRLSSSNRWGARSVRVASARSKCSSSARWRRSSGASAGWVPAASTSMPHVTVFVQVSVGSLLSLPGFLLSSLHHFAAHVYLLPTLLGPSHRNFHTAARARRGGVGPLFPQAVGYVPKDRCSRCGSDTHRRVTSRACPFNARYVAAAKVGAVTKPMPKPAKI